MPDSSEMFTDNTAKQLSLSYPPWISVDLHYTALSENQSWSDL